MPRDETEAAYFALLRAREDLDALRRYSDFLLAESQRLRRTTSEGEALAGQVDPRLLRNLRHTDRPLADAVKARLAVIEEERTALRDRIPAAEAYVEECEREHAELRRRA